MDVPAAKLNGRDPDVPVAASAWRLLALLTMLNVLNFLDRQLLVGLAPLLIEDLGLTRTEIGLLAGFAFVAVFSVAGLLLGAAADRFSRIRLIAAGLALWSLMTAASGAATGFGHLAMARLLVGVGEATLIPAGLSLLADTFPPARLGLAAAVFTAGAPVGQALSYWAAGLLAPHLGWRGCFAVLGSVGLLFAVALLAVTDPPRRGQLSAGPPIRPTEIASDLGRMMLGVPAAGLLILGIAALAFAAGGALHTITWLVQERGFAHPRAAVLSGLLTAAVAPLGNLTVGAIADRRERRAPGGRAWTLAGLAPFAAAAAALFYTAPPSSPAFYVGWVLSAAGLMSWLGASLAACELLAPPRIRATAVAFAILCLNLLGLGPGALAVGWLGDARSLTFGLLLSAGICLLAMLPFAVAASRWRVDSERARSIGATH